MKLIIYLGSFFMVNFCVGQNIYKNENLGFSIEQPKNWIVAEKNEILKNIKEQIQLNPIQLAKIIEEGKGSINVGTFFKYRIEEATGMIPTIKIRLLKNQNKTIELLTKSIENSFMNFRNTFPDFKFSKSPTVVELNGLKSVFTECSYTVRGNGNSEKVKTIVYSIPIGSNYYQLTFMDTEKDNNAKLFDQLIKTIKIK